MSQDSGSHWVEREARQKRMDRWWSIAWIVIALLFIGGLLFIGFTNGWGLEDAC